MLMLVGWRMFEVVAERVNVPEPSEEAPSLASVDRHEGRCDHREGTAQLDSLNPQHSGDMSAFAKGKLKLIKEALAAKDWAVVQKQATSVAHSGLPSQPTGERTS